MADINPIRTTPRHDIFWGEISPGEHLCQLYDDDTAMLDALEGFVAGGLDIGEAIIIIATPEHRAMLEKRVWARGHDLAALRRDDRYIDLDAQETLDKFMDNLDGQPWPDERKFQEAINAVLTRARWGGLHKNDGRKVRAFGEMVALLWAQGHAGATVRLEHLWHQLCALKTFSLFCAYPRTGLSKHGDAAVRDICDAHTRMIGVHPL